METETSTQIATKVQSMDIKDLSLLIGFLMFVLKDAWSWLTGSTRKHIEAIEKNTSAVKELQIHLDYMRADIQEFKPRFEKLERDVNEAHARIRSISKDLPT